MLAAPEKALLGVALCALIVNAATNMVFPAAVGRVVDRFVFSLSFCSFYLF